MQLLYLGGISSALGYALWNYGLRFLDASAAAPYINLIPVVGLVLGVLLLHDPFNLIQVGGGALTLLGVYFSNKSNKRQLPSAKATHQKHDEFVSSSKDEGA